MKGFERFSKVWITLPWCRLSLLSSAAPPPLSLSHTLHDIIILFYFIIIRIPQQSIALIAGSPYGRRLPQSKLSKWEKEKKRGIMDHHPNNAISFSFLFFLFDNINKKQPCFSNTWNVMQCPLLVLECRQITRKKATTESSISSRDGRSPSCSFIASCARAACAPRRLPWHLHAYRALGPLSEWARLRNSARGTSLFLSISPLLDTFWNRRPLGLS